ncbi:sigma-70 family RNA polymerase sigma factor [Aureibaculum sp. 2210JD6-5]|uniref:RNA polymerase sigma factor n=1 Tax=Aureibaculum sp. 2210JD6-5 TaxID=3103957 RepID=UPI002AAD2A77|nr:sigma-70 family RNA polymerase sigma factor [Aureibaculum sp. 2210JD6-5]MDY7394715.1 sigma-70 family RNA polymerase sigma factor [Aureibaculum sp. 2210JD6-5]
MTQSKSVCDESVFASIYNSYSKDLHNYLYYKYGNRHDPNDTVQEAFVKLWKNCKEVSFEKAKGFVFMVSKNMMLNEIKHQKVILKHQQVKPKDYTGENPEFLLEKEQFYQKYQRALAKLTEEQRVAFLLNKTEGKKHQEIAEMLNITKKVVEYRIYSAFKIIKAEIKELN